MLLNIFYYLGLEYESSNKTITKEEFEAVQISQLKVGRHKGEILIELLN